MNRPTDVAQAVAQATAAAARSIHQAQSLEETLQAIAYVARDSVPGFDQVGISTLRKGGKVETMAATGHLVYALDSLQYDLGEGPCLETLRDAEIVVAPRIRQDQRWPRYVPAAVGLGLRAQLGIKLYVDDEGTLGGLNLYSTTTDEIHPEAESIADLFAVHAAVALTNAHERDTLDQALGMIMERYEMSEDRAFAFLVRASSHSNHKIRDIAQEIVDQRNSGKAGGTR